MVCFPNCKINLGLYITRKRDDGYHELETVFYPLSQPVIKTGYSGFRDVLEIIPAAETRLHLSGLAVNGDQRNNLVCKAYELLRRDFEQVPSFEIYLHKVLPMGAGLGGGSADGAFMLRLLNDYCQLGLSDAQLASYALQLGSDCPFFIYNTPQFATGRGEQMTPVAIDLSGLSIQVICPAVHVSTAQAFSAITPKAAAYDLRRLSELPVNEWRHHISNDFEKPVFGRHPVLETIKSQLYEQGALYASMSGSGSAVYGIFPKDLRAQIIDGDCSEFYLP